MKLCVITICATLCSTTAAAPVDAANRWAVDPVGHWLMRQEVEPGRATGSDTSTVDQRDSTTVYHLRPVTVTAGGGDRASALMLAATSSLPPKDLRRMAGQTLDAALGRLAGLYIRDLGGGAGVKTVSLRGAPAIQSTVLFNGMKLNNVQNGLADLGLYPVELFQQVRTVRGGLSALLGQDAAGGAIDLSTDLTPHSREWSIRASGGSFGQRGLSALAEYGWDNSSIRVVAGADAADNRYPLPASPDLPGAPRAREGAEVGRRFGSIGLQTASIVPGALDLTLVAVAADRGSPGPVTSIVPPARLEDRVLHLVGRWRSPEDRPVPVEVGTSFSTQVEHFVDRFGAPPVDERYLNRSGSLWAHASGILSSEWSWGIHGEAGLATVEAGPFPSGVRRTSLGLSAIVGWTEPQSGLVLSPMLRFDRVSDADPGMSWRAAASLPLASDVRVRASIGKGFRIPCFNELYWIPGGNMSLKLERSLSSDAGLDARLSFAGSHRLSLTLFANWVDDRITGWPPVNLHRTRTSGIEFEWTWTTGRGDGVQVMGTAVRAVDLAEGGGGSQLPFIPRGTMSAQGHVVLWGIVVQPGMTAMTRRYSTTDNLIALSADPFIVVTVATAIPFTAGSYRCEWLVGADNVFDRSYEVVTGFVMPGRSFRTTLTIGTQ